MFILGPLLLIGLVGCASSADDGADSEPVKEAGLNYAQCMRDNGLPDFPDPKIDENGELELSLPDGADPDSESFVAAQEKCKKHLPNGGEPEKASPEALEKLQAYAKCMRDNGLPKFPDPDSDGGPGHIEDIDPNSPEFKAADEKCAHHMPGGGGGFVSGPEK
jgi:hypothetical protein